MGGTSSDIGQSIAVGADGAVYVTGYTYSTGAGSYDIFVAKYSATGTLDWKKTLGKINADYGYGIAVGPDAAVYVTGLGGNDFLVAKYRTDGTLDWKKTLGGTGADYGRVIAVGDDGAIYVSGYTGSAGAGGNDFLVAKYRTDGTLDWKKTLGGTIGDIGYGIAVGVDGSLYVTGTTTSAGAGGSDMIVSRLPADGGIDMTAGPFIWQDAILTVGENPVLTNNQNPTGLTDGQSPTGLTDGQNPTGLSEGNAAALTGSTTQFQD